MIELLDRHLMASYPRDSLNGVSRFLTEFWYFGIKQARACLFVGLFFAAVFLMPRTGMLGLPRYDVLLVAALLIQFGMLAYKLETLDELKTVCLFQNI